MRLWNDVKVLVCIACCAGATACSDDGGTSAESNLLQPQGGAAGSGEAGGAGTSGAAGGAANAGAAGAAGSTSVNVAAGGMAGTGSEPPQEPMSTEPMAVGFSDVVTILQDSCGGCHGAPGGFLPAFAQDDEAAAYAVTQEVSTNGDGSLYYERIVVRAVVERTMPPGCFGDALGTGECLTEEEAALLEAWVEEGGLP